MAQKEIKQYGNVRVQSLNLIQTGQCDVRGGMSELIPFLFFAVSSSGCLMVPEQDNRERDSAD